METNPINKSHKISGIGKFFGKMEIKNDDPTKVRQIKEYWNKFVNAFWAIFFFKIITKGFIEDAATSFQGNGDWIDNGVIVLLYLLQFIAILLMVLAISFSAYKISNKKSYIWIGLLGFFWFAVIGIFVGYFVVKRITNNELKKAVSLTLNQT